MSTAESSRGPGPTRYEIFSWKQFFGFFVIKYGLITFIVPLYPLSCIMGGLFVLSLIELIFGIFSYNTRILFGFILCIIPFIGIPVIWFKRILKQGYFLD